jgi:dihydrofolate reductase
MISIVVACSNNNVIGKSNGLPWYLPADLRRFKELTTGHTVAMGRKTYESIPEKFRPLPHRKNIIITRDQNFSATGATVVHSIQEAIEAAGNEELYIIGGAEIYRQAMSIADRIYLTEVDANIDGDTFFPNINLEEWHETTREPHEKDEKNPYDYTFVIFDRS